MKQLTRSNILVVVTLAVLCSANSCDEKKVKKAFREWNIKAGEMAVECNSTWDSYYKGAADQHTEDIINEHGDDPAWTDEMAEAEFNKRMAKLNESNEKFELSMNIIANSAEAIEQSLDAADHIDAKLWVKGIKDILKALDAVTMILNEAAEQVDDETFNAALDWIGVVTNGANNIIDMLGDPDPDDPKDD